MTNIAIHATREIGYEPPELDRHALSKVECGRYISASELLREALRLMQEKDELRELRIAEARLKIQNGLDALANGDFVEETPEELYQQAIARSRKRLHPGKPTANAKKV